MILTLAFLLTIQMNFNETVVGLQKTKRIEIPRWIPTHVANDGSVVAATNTRFWHWSAEGQLIHTLSVSSKPSLKLFMDVRYDPDRKLYWIANLDGLAFAVNGEGKVVFDQIPLPTSKYYRDLSYRFLIPSGPYTFGVTKGFDSLNPAAKAYGLIPILINKKQGDDQDAITTGEPFAELNELHIQTQYNYKDHWIIYDEADKGYYIMTAMSRFIDFYENQGTQAAPKFVRVSQKPFFKTKDFIVPDPTAPRRIQNKKELIEWLNLFPRITGFYKFGEGFLICYRLPNETKNNSNRQVIHRIDKTGGLIGQPQEIDAKIIGCYNDAIYTLEQGDFGLRLRLLSFDKK